MVKEKPNSIRTYDEEGYRRRAACLCFKDETEQEVKCQLLLGPAAGKFLLTTPALLYLMTKVCTGVVICFHCFHFSGESYEKSCSKSLMFSNNKAVEQVKIFEHNRE